MRWRNIRHVHAPVPSRRRSSDLARRQGYCNGAALNAPMEEALLLQKPPPGGALKIVAVETK